MAKENRTTRYNFFFSPIRNFSNRQEAAGGKVARKSNDSCVTARRREAHAAAGETIIIAK